MKLPSEAEDAERRHAREAVHAAGGAAQLSDEHPEYLSQADGGQRQVEVAQLQHRPPDDERNDPGNDRPDDQGGQGGHVELDAEQPGRVGPHAVEGRMPERQLTGLAEDDADADGENGKQAGGRHHAHGVHVFVHERPHQKDDHEHRLGYGHIVPLHESARVAHGSGLDLGRVRRGHHISPSVIVVPRMPCGRK